MTLSNEDSNVSWKLNELIHASRRAAYRRYESLEHTDKEQEFVPWSPTMLKLIDDQIVELESNDQETEEVPENPEENDDSEVIEEQLIAESQVMLQVQESYQRGFEEGKAAAESEFSGKLLELEKLINGFTSAQSNLESFHSPLVKLALALANHLARAELTLNKTAIEELIQQSLAAIENSGEGQIIVFLSEDDLVGAESVLNEKYGQIKFEIDNSLSPGSVRVVMDDTLIEDLIENRLDSLANQILKTDTIISSDNQLVAEDEGEPKEDKLVDDTDENSTIDGAPGFESDLSVVEERKVDEESLMVGETLLPETKDLDDALTLPVSDVDLKPDEDNSVDSVEDLD